MQLRLSTLARDRKYSKAMRRVRAKLQPLLDAFEAVVMRDPIHQAILVGITDDKGPEFFEEVENDDGFFQVMAGCRYSGTDGELTEEVFGILLRAVSLCPFSKPDHSKFDALFEKFRPTLH